MAVHIREFDIESFRGIKDLELKNLGDINLITGDNNTGKTSVLELISTLQEPFNLQTWLRLGDRTKNSLIGFVDKFDMLFNVNDEQKNIKYITKYDQSNDIKIEIDVDVNTVELSYKEAKEIDEYWFNYKINSYINESEDNEDLSKLYLKTFETNQYNIKFMLNKKIIQTDVFYDFQGRIGLNKIYQIKSLRKKIVYISPVQHAYSDIFLNDVLNDPILYEEMLDVLRLFDDGIISINADKINDDRIFSGTIYKILSKNNKKAVPLNFYGDGIKKAIILLSAVVKAKNGILLLDEFEVAIHTSAMQKVFSWILETCLKLNVQLFMTSHSKEAIDKVLNCSPEIQEKIRLITLYANKDKTVARIVDGKKAVKLKDDLGVELR